MECLGGQQVETVSVNSFGGEAWLEREGTRGCRIKKEFGIFKLLLSK